MLIFPKQFKLHAKLTSGWVSANPLQEAKRRFPSLFSLPGALLPPQVTASCFLQHTAPTALHEPCPWVLGPRPTQAAVMPWLCPPLPLAAPDTCHRLERGGHGWRPGWVIFKPSRTELGSSCSLAVGGNSGVWATSHYSWSLRSSHKDLLSSFKGEAQAGLLLPQPSRDPLETGWKEPREGQYLIPADQQGHRKTH